MQIRTVDRDIVEATVLPCLVRLGDNLFGAAFSLMKLLPARFILDRARDQGLLQPGSTVIETSSGTFALALAMLCCLRGYRLILVSDPAIEPPLQRRLEELGARVEIVREPAKIGGFQRARLDRMAQLRAENPGHFWPSQYDNQDNPRAYGPFAEQIVEAIGAVHVVVGTCGSGGSMCGTTTYLRRLFPELKSIAVDTHGSVLFGQPDAGKRMLRGLGNSLMPKNLDHSVFDEIHWVGAAEAFAATRALHREHALYMGPTSGAAMLVGAWYARQQPTSQVVVLLADEGYRYQDTIYDDAWLESNGLLGRPQPAAPIRVEHPRDARDIWSSFAWRRRSYEAVMGAPFDGGAS